MRVAGGDEGFIVNNCSVGKREVEIAVLPFGLRFARHRQLAFLDRGKVARIPFHGLQCDACVRDVATIAGIRSAGIQALERIDNEWQWLVFDLDALDRVGSDGFIDGRDRQDRFTDVMRIVGQNALASALGCWYILGSQDTEHAVHRQRVTGINAGHPGMWHRAKQHFAKDHTRDAKVFCIFRFAGNFGAKIGWSEILS